MMLYSQHRSRRGAFAGFLVLLLPVLSPQLFSLLGQALPSVISEEKVAKPRHWHLLNSALDRPPLDEEHSDLWSALPNLGLRRCDEPLAAQPLPTQSQGYIQVFLDGGLNQQRMGICDAVAVAKILNATLVIPYLEFNAVWKDSSSFGDIYDVDHFIKVLKDDINIVRDLPSEFSWSTRELYATGIRETRVKSAPVHASASWYLDNVLPILQRSAIANF